MRRSFSVIILSGNFFLLLFSFACTTPETLYHIIGTIGAHRSLDPIGCGGECEWVLDDDGERCQLSVFRFSTKEFIAGFCSSNTDGVNWMSFCSSTFKAFSSLLVPSCFLPARPCTKFLFTNFSSSSFSVGFQMCTTLRTDFYQHGIAFNIPRQFELQKPCAATLQLQQV